jgi:hypothetical protein
MPVCCRISALGLLAANTGSLHVQSWLRTDAGRPLYFQRPDKVGNPLYAVFKAPALQTVDNLFRSAGVPEICGAYFHSGRAGNATCTTYLVYRQLETFISFPDMEYSNRQVFWLSKLMQYRGTTNCYSRNNEYPVVI